MIRHLLALIGGEGFGSRNIGIRSLLKCFLVQKGLRVNSHVSWPVHWTSTVKAPHKIARGTRFPGLSNGCHIDGRNGIVIEENVWIGPRVSIISMNHDMSDFHRYEYADPIVIRKNSWLATNAVILPGVVLGEHTVVAAGAIVTKSFPEGDQILAGCPARIVKKLEAYRGG